MSRYAITMQSETADLKFAVSDTKTGTSWVVTIPGQMVPDFLRVAINQIKSRLPQAGGVWVYSLPSEGDPIERLAAKTAANLGLDAATVLAAMRRK